MLQKSREITKKRQDNESTDEDESADITLTDLEKRRVAATYGDNEEGKQSSTPSDLANRHLEILKAVNKKGGGWLDGPTAFVYNDSNEADSQKAGKVTDLTPKMNASDVGFSVPKSVEVNKSAPSNILDASDEDDEEKIAIISKNEGKHSSKNLSDVTSIVNENKDKANADVQSSRKRKREDEEEKDGGEAQYSDDEMLEKEVAEDTSPKKRKKKKKKGDNNESLSETVVKDNKPIKVKELTLHPSAQEAIDKMEEDEEEKEEEDDGMKVTMEELFEDEDVVEQFAKDKRELEEQKKPKVQEKRLPGWGSWSGPDYKDKQEKPQPQKRRKK